MAGRTGRSAGVYAALGLLWWATIRLARRGMSCGDWPCLAPSVAALVLITAAFLAGAAWVLGRVGVAHGRRVAVRAAWTLAVLRLAGEALPSWTASWPQAVTAAAAFAVAGGAAGFATTPGLAARWRRLTALGVLALVPLALMAIWLRAPL
ncbi:hypothetical protein [Nonomuraea sp. NPDC003214]